MKQSLHMKMSQQQTITAQLQHSLRILQLSTHDLSQEITQALQSNPFLEREDANEQNSPSPDQDVLAHTGLVDLGASAATVQQEQWSAEAEPPSWQMLAQQGSTAAPAPDLATDFAASSHCEETLQGHLEWQLYLAPLTAEERMIGLAIIEGIDSQGYLRISLDDVVGALPQRQAMTRPAVEKVLNCIQQFEPAGVGGRDVRECLLLQLRQMGENTPPAELAQLIVENHLDLVEKQEFRALCRRLAVNESQLSAALEVMRCLDPYPGARIGGGAAEYVVPDVLVGKHQGQWRVRLNPDAAPRLHVNSHYASLVGKDRKVMSSHPLKQQLVQAKQLVQGVRNRHDTLLKVATCLVKQHQTHPTHHPSAELAQLIVENHLDLVEKQEFRALCRRLAVNESQLSAALEVMRCLDPYPGARIGGGAAEYVVPDVLVGKHQGQWRVRLNPDAAPRLHVNSHYASLVGKDRKVMSSHPLKQQLVQAKQLVQGVRNRHDTLLKVATCLVKQQYDFLESGVSALKPLILNDIAESLGLHNSTVSRATAQKYIHTPRGVFELKYFFSHAIAGSSGEQHSTTAIKAMIKAWIDSEDRGRPFSDSKIVAMLADSGITVARRTVSKYREAQSIPSSAQRKKRI